MLAILCQAKGPNFSRSCITSAVIGLGKLGKGALSKQFVKNIVSIFFKTKEQLRTLEDPRRPHYTLLAVY